MGKKEPLQDTGKQYKIKLQSGRIVGPIGVRRIAKLVQKKQITGVETAREYPEGEWLDINQVPELAELLISHLGGTLPDEDTAHVAGLEEPSDPMGTTVIVGSGPKIIDESTRRVTPEDDEAEDEETQELEDDLEETVMASELDRGEIYHGVSIPGKSAPETSKVKKKKGPTKQRALLSDEKTISLKKKVEVPADKDPKPNKLKLILLGILVLLLGHEFLFEENTKTEFKAPDRIRAQLPSFTEGDVDPEKSKKLYEEGLKYYVMDNALGYQKAAEIFLQSGRLDSSNIKSLALLASSYLNLIDSSNKDENYFSVITKLIELSKAKSVELTETVIAETEFYLMIDNAEAAEKTVQDYSKKHKFGLEIYYYLALSLYRNRKFGDAARYLSQIPDNKAFSPKVFYLRGRVAEALEFGDEALKEYQKALGHPSGKAHAKSRLRIAAIHEKRGTLTNAAKDLDALAEHPYLMSPKERAQTFYLRSKLLSSRKKWKAAITEIKRAVQQDPKNHKYVLELYQLRAKAGESVEALRPMARMFFFLGEGEKALMEGRAQEAVDFFIQARQADLKNVTPLIRIGDAFVKLNDLGNARINYEKAVKLVPKNAKILAKLIKTLIGSYDWDEAQKAMETLRGIPGSDRWIHKLAGDLYAQQRQYQEALVYYKKAMAQDWINPEVYVSYAESLNGSGQYRDAPFFFALARRFDPLNMDAITGTAQSIARSETMDRAIRYLQKEMQKLGKPRAELLAQIAEFEAERGEWKKSQDYVNQALKADPTYARSYWIQAKLHLNDRGKTRKAVDRALDAYKSYSDRNPSDPNGYLERHQLFIDQTKFGKAAEELDRVFSLFPKYPNLHFYRGKLYAAMGNQKESVRELVIELENHPSNVSALMFLGREYLKMKQNGEALKAFNRAMAISPRSAEPKQMAGYVNFLEKNYEGAVALYRSAIPFDQGNPIIYKRLGMAYQALGKRNEAAAAFRDYLRLAPDAPDRKLFERYQ